jgi:nitroimidazol reductase NimA-like FMN-containing flavoprotein (pyridoxamine 5'-phosphate oxidase superfamily)
MTMFEAIRRADRATDEETAREILNKGVYGVIATIGTNGYPTATPFNYAVDGENIYLHGFKEGHVQRSILANSHISFCVVTSEQVLASDFSSDYESAIVHADATLVEDKEEKRLALRRICEKYSPEHMERALPYIEASIDHTAIFRLKIVNLTGKIRKS